MKKLFPLLLVFTMCISLSACSAPAPAPCETCSDEKIISCSKCVDGVKKCPYCLGNGTNTCSKCGGIGKTTDLTCPTCDGEGGIINPITWEFFECSACKGTGGNINAEATSCAHCGGDGLVDYNCFICDNTGMLDEVCSTCDGEGKIPCPDCTEAEQTKS